MMSEDMKAEPKLTQNMTLHLNGGSKFSSLHYEILADGKPTGIFRITKTNGRPNYKKTEDRFYNDNGEFDILANKGAGAKEWLLVQVQPSRDLVK